MSTRLNKAALRQLVREKRSCMEPAWRAEQSALVQARLLALPAVSSAAVAGLYQALSGEVDLGEVEGTLMRHGTRVCVPAFDPELGTYALAMIGESTRFIDAPFGLREPVEPQWADPAGIDCIVVPGVAFDVTGHRIGHGGGHYDRMLAGTSALKVGVAFDFQVFDTVPAEPHDVAMDAVVTPTRVMPGVRPARSA